MPELPEVETICRGVAPFIEGQTIQRIQVRQPKLRWPVPEQLSQILSGQQIIQVSRRAKYLLFSMPSGTLLIHLGMSGSLKLVPVDQPVGKHDHIDILFSHGSLLRFNDPRRFGSVLWTADPVEQHPLLKSLGPEPLSDAFTGEQLYSWAKTRHTAVKSFIMNSHIVVGVGNIYANEALFSANIRPDRKASSISLNEYCRLADNIRTVLQQAITQGGTTLRDFVNESGKPGYFQQQLMVYGRAGLACYHCQQLLTEIRIANRSTVFCNHCQH